MLHAVEFVASCWRRSASDQAPGRGRAALSGLKWIRSFPTSQLPYRMT